MKIENIKFKAKRLDNSPQITLMWKMHQAFSTHRRTLISERLIKTPIRYYFDNIMEMVKRREYGKNECNRKGL